MNPKKYLMMKNLNEFSILVIETIKSIPRGKVATYGQIAHFCGNPRGARQVSRILHSCTAKYRLPWHRVVNSRGRISLSGQAADNQAYLLAREGVEIDGQGQIDMQKFLASLFSDRKFS
ncbi:MAG: MGMT family protein [Candidatus Rifleibacteriota bacterium]